MTILVAGLAALGAAVIIAFVAFFVLMFIFERTFSSDEGLGIVALAGAGAVASSVVALAGTFVTLA